MTETRLPLIVRGEIQPWTDEHPAGGPALVAFLADLLPERAGRALIAGPHHTDVLDLVAGRAGELTVLVRSVSDAAALSDRYPVVNGALDGLAAENPPRYDVIVAADGLDRLLGPDSADLDWPERAALLRGLAAPGAVVVIRVENAFSITGLLDRRPSKDRHGDDEWRPLHDDPRRPSSPDQAAAVLGEPGRSLACYRVDGRVDVLVDSGALRRTGNGFLAERLARAGLAAEASGTPLLAPVTDAAEAAARAGMTGAVAPGWLVVLGEAGETHTAYTGSLTADLGADGWRIGDRIVPDTENAETVLFRLAAAEDVPGFRAYAGRLADAGSVAFFDEIHDFVPAPFRDFGGDATAEERLAAAWFRFRDRLIGGHRRHPWPPWMADGDDLVRTWLAMSGIDATPELLERGRELAGAPEERPDLRTALAGAEAAEQKIKEQAGHIFGLERTMRFRDQQLRTREQQLRTLRDELRRLKSGRAVRAVSFAGRVARLRDPKRLAGAVKRRAKAFLLR